jgi:TM2 domain-containing membrane protein YozV
MVMQSLPAPGSTSSCILCASPLDSGAQFCTNCGARVAGAAARTPPPLTRLQLPGRGPIQPKQPWVAAGLSVFPGLGQLYNGKATRAFGILAAVVVLGVWYASTRFGFIGLGLLGVWVWSIVDAYLATSSHR